MDAGTIGALGVIPDENTLLLIVAAIVGLTQAAARIAQLIPGKAGDEITSTIELFARKALDFVAGNHGNSDDPTAVKK